MKSFVLGIITAFAVLVAAGLAAIYGGIYNVAADEPHTTIEKWILGTAMTNSVKAHARSIVPPSDFGAEHRIHDGYHLFDEMCVQCHGAPGKKPGEVGLGLRPEPPDLSRAVTRWNTAQLNVDCEARDYRNWHACFRGHAHRRTIVEPHRVR